MNNYQIFLKAYLLSCIALYLPAYHISKTLLEVSILFTTPYLLSHIKLIRESSRYLSAFTLTFLILSLSYVIADLSSDSSRDQYYFLESIRIFIPIILYIAVIRGTKHSISIQEVIVAISIGCLLSSGIAILKWYNSGFHARVSVGTNLILVYASSLALSITVLFSALLFAPPKKKHLKLFIAAVIFISSIALYATMAEGSIISICITIPTIILLYYFPIKRVGFMLTGVILIATASLIYMENINSWSGFIQFTKDIYPVNSSEGIRLEMWRASISKIYSEPLSAQSTTELKYIFAEEIEGGQVHPVIGKFLHVHNDYLQAWLSRGPLGILSIILLLILPLTIFSKHSPYLKIGFALSLTEAIISLTNVPLMHSYSLRYYVLLVSLLMISYISSAKLGSSKGN